MLAHIVEIHNEKSANSRACDTILRATHIFSNFGNCILALESTKSLLQHVITTTSSDDEDGMATMNTYMHQLEDSTVQARSSKYVAGKALRSLEELRARSMTLIPDSVEIFDQTSAMVSQLSHGAIELWSLLHPHLDVMGSEESIDISSIAALMNSFRLLSLATPQNMNCLTILASHMAIVSAKLNQILTLSTSLSQTIEFTRHPAPWTLLASSLSSTTLLPPAISSELIHLKSSLQARLEDLHTRDRTISEQFLKIELLESRMRDATAKAARIEELEELLEKAVQRGEELAKEIEARLEEVNKLSVERNQLRLAVEDDEDGNTGAGRRTVASAREVHALKLEIEHLQHTVRHLHQQSSPRARYTASETSWLSEPLIRGKKPSKAAREAAEAVEKEGVALLEGLIGLVLEARVVGLEDGVGSADRLRWRPLAEKSAWIVAGERERWEGWVGRGKGWVERVGGV